MTTHAAIPTPQPAPRRVIGRRALTAPAIMFACIGTAAQASLVVPEPENNQIISPFDHAQAAVEWQTGAWAPGVTGTGSLGWLDPKALPASAAWGNLLELETTEPGDTATLVRTMDRGEILTLAFAGPAGGPIILSMDNEQSPWVVEIIALDPRTFALRAERAAGVSPEAAYFEQAHIMVRFMQIPSPAGVLVLAVGCPLIARRRR